PSMLRTNRSPLVGLPFALRMAIPSALSSNSTSTPGSRPARSLNSIGMVTWPLDVMRTVRILLFLLLPLPSSLSTLPCVADPSYHPRTSLHEETGMADGFEFPVDRTQVMLFARSVLDINPAFVDPDSPEAKANGGLVTPPTFVQSSAHYQPDYALDLTRPRKDAAPAHRGDAPGGGGG